MITSICTAFRGSISYSKHGEVDLFRSLAAEIENYAPAVFIDETHGGNKCNVSFTSALGKRETCEIADLLIVSCSPSGSFRATFWQAKKLARSNWLRATHDEHQIDFSAQYDQWDLLARRPMVTPVAKFRPPPGILSAFISDSIGSYGLFYQRHGAVEVAHSTASVLACQNPSVKKTTKLCLNGYLSPYHLTWGERIVCLSLADFLADLLGFRIGALLELRVLEHRWILRRSLHNAPSSSSPVVERVLAALSDFDDPPLDIEDGTDGLSVLIVETTDDE